MNKIKDYGQSPDNRAQIKALIIGLAVLVATFGATYLTGLITSLKSASQEVQPPFIFIETEDDLLKAKSPEQIETWQYIGPSQQSSCDESLFNNFLGFGKTFKEGNQVRLEYERDINKYYCFKGVDEDGVANFVGHYIKDLQRPAITFQQTDRSLTASLGNHVDQSLFDETSWQYIVLADSNTACGSEVFGNSQEIFNQSKVELAENNQEISYCFRIQQGAGYTYQAKSILGSQGKPTKISTIKSNNKLYLLADQRITDWAVIAAEEDVKCDASYFTGDTHHINTRQIAILNFQQPADYCIRAQNEIGIFSYQSYIHTSDPVNIMIQVALDSNANSLSLQTSTDTQASQWQVADIGQISACNADAFSDASQVVAQSSKVDLNYPNSQAHIYCWQARSNETFAYAFYLIPSSNKMIVAYPGQHAIEALALLRPLQDWQYVERATDDNSLGDHCAEIDFSTSVNAGQQASFKAASDYCFSAVDELGQRHYGIWTRGAIQKLDLALEELAVNLANDLQLAGLGRSILYDLKPRLYENKEALLSFCPSTTKVGCYALKDKRLHLLKKASFTKAEGNELRQGIAQAIRHNYLSDQQRSFLDFELLVLYQQHRENFSSFLPANFYGQHFYEDQFIEDFYNYLIVNPSYWSKGHPIWRNYYELFFQ